MVSEEIKREVRREHETFGGHTSHVEIGVGSGRPTGIDDPVPDAEYGDSKEAVRQIELDARYDALHSPEDGVWVYEADGLRVTFEGDDAQAEAEAFMNSQ